ncbi:pseudouridine synthase [Alphaproteobacteria bacterium]|nr:pseudouridine synthase [Alphaproteobacteria bacterium]
MTNVTNVTLDPFIASLPSDGCAECTCDAEAESTLVDGSNVTLASTSKIVLVYPSECSEAVNESSVTVDEAISASPARIRLDKFLASELQGYSRSKIQSMIEAGNVSVNGVIVLNASYLLKIRDEIEIMPVVVPETNILDPDGDVNFSILYEDDDLIVVNKPAGVVVHPGAGNYDHTLVNGLAYYYGSLSSGGDSARPGIVHRIDKDTSGILVVAKNDYAHEKLAEQFKIHSIKRKYICFCYGVINPRCGKIETFISRDKCNRTKMAVSKDSGKWAISIYRTLKIFSNFVSKVECELHTGRTHQIRVHMAHLGHSLIGDSTYRSKNYNRLLANPTIQDKTHVEYVRNFTRQALHAYFLEFIHPRSQKLMHFESELPDDMQELESMLEGL